MTAWFRSRPDVTTTATTSACGTVPRFAPSARLVFSTRGPLSAFAAHVRAADDARVTRGRTQGADVTNAGGSVTPAAPRRALHTNRSPVYTAAKSWQRVGDFRVEGSGRLDERNVDASVHLGWAAVAWLGGQGALQLEVAPERAERVAQLHQPGDAEPPAARNRPSTSWALRWLSKRSSWLRRCAADSGTAHGQTAPPDVTHPPAARADARGRCRRSGKVRGSPIGRRASLRSRSVRCSRSPHPAGRNPSIRPGPPHQAFDLTGSPASVVFSAIGAGTASPVFAISRSWVAGCSLGHHTSMDTTPVCISRRSLLRSSRAVGRGRRPIAQRI